MSQQPLKPPKPLKNVLNAVLKGLNPPVNPLIGLKQKMNMFEHVDTHETSLTGTNSPQNLSPGRFRHAESESEVENLETLHPDPEIKENQFWGPWTKT